jgi:hypothetical protein
VEETTRIATFVAGKRGLHPRQPTAIVFTFRQIKDFADFIH